MTFAIKRRPLDGTFSNFPFSKHTKTGLTQCFWTKKHLFQWLQKPNGTRPLNGKCHEKFPLFSSPFL